MASRSQSHYLDLGVLGEELVTQWLRSSGWTIRNRRWRCRWGEIDIVALAPELPKLSEVAFVEVKTRSRGNWDANGLLSITPRKQVKLQRTAQCFFANYPKLAERSCRFDVALVYCQQLSTQQRQPLSETQIHSLTTPIHLGQAVRLGDYQLVLQEYIVSAF